MTVECICCVENVSESVEIDGSDVCHNCIRNLFDQALKYSHSYPVKFGPIRLEPDQFKQILSEDFIERFRKREEEYQADIEDRAQIASELEADGLKRGKDFAVCPGPPGLNCGRTYQRSEGCSEMLCPRCGQGFCYACGEATAPHSDHWTRGGCPRFDGGPNGPQYDDDQVQPNDDDDDEFGDPAILTELIEGGFVQGLAAAVLRRAIVNGRLDDQEDEPWIRRRIFWFGNRFAPREAADNFLAIDRAIRSYIRETSHSVREVGLLWREMGRNSPAPLTEIQQVVVRILENMDIDQFGTGEHHAQEGAHNILGFVDRHRQIEEAIISYDLEHGLHRMHRDYPLVMTHWSYYNDRIPEANRIAWASELGRLQMDFDAFNRAQGLEILELRAQGTLGNHIARIRAETSFASRVHVSIGEMRRLNRQLPRLSYLRSFISRDIDTELWFRRHQELIALFRQYEEEGWSETLPRHYVQWQEYLARLPAGLHHHLASR